MNRAGRSGATKTAGTSGSRSGSRTSSPAIARATLYVSGTVSNQGRFYPRFDAVVLRIRPAEVLLSRIENRTTNDYGKSADERDLILGHLADVEPLLRATCTHEIDATQPIEKVVAELLAIGADIGG